MPENARSLLDTRRDQMFPTLTSADIDRLRRFGQPRPFAKGELVTRAGKSTEGLMVILTGEIRMAPPGAHDKPIVTHTPGSFLGELAQLSGRAALVDGSALSDGKTLLISPASLRDLMVQEAELGERIMRALILRRVGLLEQNVGGPIIVGRAGDRDVLRLQGFLRRNGHPYQTFDPGSDGCAQVLTERFHLGAGDLPAVLCVNGDLLRNPSESQLARAIGLSRPLDTAKVYDVAIVGAGPAGLAAAVYAASEGLAVLVLDCRAFGGQAGASARIENYMGFPTGISGIALMARAYNQANKFGAEIAVPEQVLSLVEEQADDGPCYTLHLVSNQSVRARAVVIASGAAYRRLAVANLADYEGSHVHYWASPLEARLCAGKDVALVGAGNSAGQAAVFLAGVAAKVSMIVRGKALTDTMSRYLCDRIAAQPNIEVLLETQVVALDGKTGALKSIRLRRKSDNDASRAVEHLFLLIGAAPNSTWLTQSDVALDAKGFVLTAAPGTAGRHSFETNRPGVFAIGDVRAGSIKRVAASVGEGAQVVAALHTYLAERQRRAAVADA